MQKKKSSKLAEEDKVDDEVYLKDRFKYELYFRAQQMGIERATEETI